MYCTITYMSLSIFESAESVSIPPALQNVLSALDISKQDLEEVLLNFPIVKKITLIFSDSHQRFYAEGMSDTGKRLGIVFYIHNKKMIPTAVQKV